MQEIALRDSLKNLVTGLGTVRDKATHAHFRHRYDLTKTELEAAYTSDWMAGTIVDAAPDDGTRQWRTWTAGPRKIRAIEELERALDIRRRVNRGWKMGRLYGGGALYMGVRSGRDDPAEELDIESVKKGDLDYVHVLSRYELIVSQIDRDPLSPYFGQPLVYRLATSSGRDSGALIHPSRVIRFLGQERLELSMSIDGWGHSVLQRVYDAVRDAAMAAGNIATLTNEAKIDVVSMPGLTRNSRDPEYRQAVIARFGVANMAKSIQSMLLLDKEEEWDQKTISFGGMTDVVAKFVEIAAAAAQMPLTRFLGQSPKGLNATGQVEVRHWYDTISAYQNNELRPVLTPLDEIMIRSALGSRPADVGYEFEPLWQMTEAEAAAIAVQKAQVAEIHGTLGILAPSVMRAAIVSQVLEDNVYPGLAELLIQAPMPEPKPGEEPEPLIGKTDEVLESNAKTVATKA